MLLTNHGEVWPAGRRRHANQKAQLAPLHPSLEEPASEPQVCPPGEVLLGRQEPDERSAALVALVQVSGLIDACVPDGERRRARHRASQIAAGDEVGQAVKRIQEEVIAAVTAAVVAASAATSPGGQT